MVAITIPKTMKATVAEAPGAPLSSVTCTCLASGFVEKARHGEEGFRAKKPARRDLRQPGRTQRAGQQGPAAVERA